METQALLELAFIPAPDDYPLVNAIYQNSLRQFAHTVEAEGTVSIDAKRSEAHGTDIAGAAYTGLFVLNAVSASVKQGITDWVTDRSGRQVRVGVGLPGRRPTAEVQTAEEVGQLLAKAEECIEILRDIRETDAIPEIASVGSGEVNALTITLRLIPAPDDRSSWDNRAYQDELDEFERRLTSEGLEAGRLLDLRESAEHAPTISSFLIAVAPNVSGILCAVMVGWLHARYGRKVRLKIGEIEAEAQSAAEVKTLLKLAAEFQQSAQVKLIREP